jgi:hypothetical protein
VLAPSATKEIPVSCAGNGAQRGVHPVFDPATGALIVSAYLNPKIRKALVGEVRRMKPRLDLRLLSLDLRQLLFNFRRLGVLFNGQLAGDYSDFVGGGHG